MFRLYRHVWTWYKIESDNCKVLRAALGNAQRQMAGRGLATTVTNSDVRDFHSRMEMRSVSPRLFDGLQTSSLTLGNSMNAISVHVTIEIYISSL